MGIEVNQEELDRLSISDLFAIKEIIHRRIVRDTGYTEPSDFIDMKKIISGKIEEKLNNIFS